MLKWIFNPEEFKDNFLNEFKGNKEQIIRYNSELINETWTPKNWNLNTLETNWWVRIK